MTKTEIIAELRRSAAEDADPWYDAGTLAFWSAMNWYDAICVVSDREVDRLFFLILAHALEDECAAI